MNDNFVNGFAQRCKQRGCDPEAVIKYAHARQAPQPQPAVVKVAGVKRPQVKKSPGK